MRCLLIHSLNWGHPDACRHRQNTSSGEFCRYVAVARAGVEPATFHFSGERCYQLSYLAKIAVTSPGGNVTAFATPTGLEPATSAVTGRRANQLRYGALTALSALPGARETIAQEPDRAKMCTSLDG